MKNHKLKTVLVLLATFALGIIFGAMLNRAISQNRIKRYMALRTRDGLIFRLRRILGPHTVQAKEVRDIIAKYGKRLGEVNRDMREQYGVVIKDFFNDLSGVLTPEQMERVLKDLPLARRMRRGPRGPRDKQNPPGPKEQFRQKRTPVPKEQRGKDKKDKFI